MRLIGVCVVLLASAVAAGCGGDDEPEITAMPEAATAEPATDERAGSAEPPTHEREPRVLELPDNGTPVVSVKKGQQVDLHDEPGGKVLKTVGHETEFGSRTAYAVQQHRDGWAAVPTPLFENGHLAWLKLDPRKLDAGWVALEVRIDLSDFHAAVYRRGKLLREFQISIGMPEAPTPTGRFAVTDTFRGGLNPAYGCCAVALTARQTHLPSGWLGGDRIAIHGTSGPLGAAISHGCVRAADPEVSLLVDKLPPGTPVTIRQ
jgi:L,D-transpeptidase catalytic domain